MAYLSDRLSLLPHKRFDGFPDNQWLIGSKNHANYAAWTDTMDYLSWLGAHFCNSADRRELTVAAMTSIQNHVLALTDLFCNGADDVPGLTSMPGVHPRVVGDIAERNSLILFDIDGWDANELVLEYCRRGIHIRARHLDTFAKWALTGLDIDHPVLRASASHCTSPEEIFTFLRVTAELAAQEQQ